MSLLKSRFFLSIMASLLAGSLAWLYLRAREDELLRRGSLVRVIAAGRYLSAYTRLRPDDLQWREIPAEYAVKGYIAEKEGALGQLTLVAFNAGEPLSYNKVASGSANLSHSVPEGMRALSVPVDRVSGIEGLLRPGDLVDVLYLDGPKRPGSAVSLLFQGAKVLAAGGYFSGHQEAVETGGSVTLALSPADAQAAMLAVNTGILQLALRSPGDSRLVPSGALRAARSAAGSERGPDFVPQKR